MTSSPSPLPISTEPDDDVEIGVVDLGFARAFWEGVPAARLLARIRMHRDEQDLVDLDERASGVDFDDASWDLALARMLASSPASLDRVKRAVARHTRAAFDEGPLAGSDVVIAALVHAHLSSADVDASPAEGAAEAHVIDESVRNACARFDDRLGRTSGERRAAPFEACLELARRKPWATWQLGALRAALDGVSIASGHGPAIVAASAPLYPWGETEVPIPDRRACALSRTDLERSLLRPQREIDAAIARAYELLPGDLPIPKIVADVTALLSKHGAILLVEAREPRSLREAPRLPPASWQPPDFSAADSALSLAGALERGAITVPRARSLLLRGGDEALDAAGKQMLQVAAHPFASAVFAEVLAAVGRERDVIRLVTYFAIAPDPAPAARALSLCRSAEVPSVLRAWLETMLPPEGIPEASTLARIASCIAALEPYAGLHEAVRPLLARMGRA